MTIKTASEYQNKEQKEIKEKKSKGDDNVWGHYANCYSFARIVDVIPFFLVLLSFQVSLKCIYRSSKTIMPMWQQAPVGHTSFSFRLGQFVNLSIPKSINSILGFGFSVKKIKERLIHKHGHLSSMGQ